MSHAIPNHHDSQPATLPPSSQVILNVETVALKSSLLTWEIGEATVEELAYLGDFQPTGASD